jgi:hypothetical protein
MLNVLMPEERQRRILTELDWFAGPPQVLEPLPSQYLYLSREYSYEVRKIGDPTTLVLIDEAHRLKMAALEQMRDIFDKGGIGVVFIGMPGLEKRLSGYPRLHSQVGFVHGFHPLSSVEVRDLLHHR